MQRRELFSSVASGFRADPKTEVQSHLRPPYSVDEALFHQECQACEGKCATVCEEEIIHIAEDKTPCLSFEKSGCSFCDACAQVCEFEVLRLEAKTEVKAEVTISSASCLAWNEVMCFSCKEPCLDNAIVFEGLFNPKVDAQKCTGCGFCIARCPAFCIEAKVA